MTKLLNIRYCILSSLLLLLISGCQQQRKTILLTGYWPPTNQMLVPFSNDPTLNPAGWIGQNYKGLGYDVYAYFPTFTDGTAKNPKGDGNFQVDYQSTYTDFNAITSKLKPIAIISYGLGAGPWEIETKAVNLAHWHDDYLDPKQPDTLPTVSTVDVNKSLHTSLPLEQIAKAVNTASPAVNAWVDVDGDPGGFLCNYMCLLGCNYANAQPDGQAISGFIHVGPNVTLEQANVAQEATLVSVINYLNKKAER